MKKYLITFAPRDGQPPFRATIEAVSPQQAVYKMAYELGYRQVYSLWDGLKNRSTSDRLRVEQILPSNGLSSSTTPKNVKES